MKNISKSRQFSFKRTIAAFIFCVFCLLPETGFAQAAASSIYATQTGTLGTTYSWIDCSLGTTVVSGDDARGSFSWPFAFQFYDNIYSTANSLSVSTNGFIRLDGIATNGYDAASNYSLSSSSTELGQIIAATVYDCSIGDIGSSWIKYLVTGDAPERVLTIEFSDIEVDYDDERYADIQVSFYETSNYVVLKLGADNVLANGADMGIHSGVNYYYNKWQEVATGTNNSWIEYVPTTIPVEITGPAASWNYGIQTGTIGTTYSWIDCSSGSFIVNNDDAQAEINWPFDFNFYDNVYTSSNTLSVCTNGFIRLDEVANTNYRQAQNYNLESTATNLGQIIAMGVYDGKVGDNGGWVRYLVTGAAPNRVFTIEYNNLEIDYNDAKYADAQVSFYESSNKIVLKLGAEDLARSSVDMGLHSGVNTYFNKWQEVKSGANNTWIEYTPPYVEVNATIGTALAYYFTLEAAFDKINDGTHQGNLTVKIEHSTTESSTAMLNASGTGSASYSNVNIYPTSTGLSISGNLDAPLIDLNGADNVIIDGRVNATGTADLSIINTSDGSVSATSAIRLINGATDNTVKYCTIKSSESRSTSGIIFFSSSTSTSGNDDNIIEYNNITNAVDANRPVNAIYSSGTSGKDNSRNIIRNNNIYDFIKHASASRGILLVDYNTEWTVDGNSFYEKQAFSATGTVTYDAIKIDNILGNGFTITNNYFGGRAAECGGSAWTKNNATNNVFNAIYLNVGTTVASSIQNNTIKNFAWNNSGSATWTGINVIGGSVDIGTTAANTIGAGTGTNSISVTGGTNGQSIYGIKVISTGAVNCYNNNIGSITGSTTSTFSTHIYGIDLSGSAVASIENNTIGSTSTANSIYASSASTVNVQKVYGIYTRSTGTTSIQENTISNLSNNTSNPAVGTRGSINGIYLSAGSNSVIENTISDLSIANGSVSTYSPSITGIHLNTDTDAQVIRNNYIYNISNTYTSFAGCVVGIFTRNSVGASTGDISSNFIHSLSVAAGSTGAQIYGIYENTDEVVYSNNIITLGGDTPTEVVGIYDVGNPGKTVDFFFNTIYISGANSGAEDSYALRYNTNNNTRDSRNNILFNARSGGAGGHYAIYYDATGGTFTANYNDYFVSGTGGVIAYSGGDQSTLALLKTATSQDANSLNTNPGFADVGGLDFSDYITSTTLSGVAGTGITTDYEGITRASSPKIGALESSLVFEWQGGTDTDFGTESNWLNDLVPPSGVDISFAASPTNDCYLDQNRILKSITNTSTKKIVMDGHQLTLAGDIVSATASQIDATAASSIVVFAGNAEQSIPSGVFVSNSIEAITLHNSHGLTQNGDLIVSTLLTLTEGAYNIGANTLSINGATSTTSGTLVGGSSSNVAIGGSGANTTLPGVLLNDLILNRSNGITMGGSVSIAGTLALSAGTLTIGANTLTISGSSPTRVSGLIDASNSSGIMEFTNSSTITLPSPLFAGSINNLTIDGNGVTAGGELTVTGILNLQSANPSATKGSLDMSTFTLNMGNVAATTGTGDVTGIVKRTQAFDLNTEYTFGSEYTNFSFIDANTKPTWISVEISIGSVPGWTWTPTTPIGQVKRLYKVACSNNSSTSQATINMRYLLSELDVTDNEESKLVFWHKFSNYDSGKPHEHGKANQDFTNHYIGVTGLILGLAVTEDLDESLVAIAYSVLQKNTWKGDVVGHETEWEQTQNWTAGAVPLSTEDVLIPGGLSYYPSLTASANAVAGTIEIETGASITANSYDLTVSGAGGAWVNHGVFYPGTGKVLFNHGVGDEVVTVSGVTNFYDIEVAANTTMQPGHGNILRIAGAGIPNVGSIVDFSSEVNTVEWNGASQTIVNPVGFGGNSGYHKLILSGSGTKTMPATAMSIADEFVLRGSLTATAQSALTIGNELEILGGATFTSGAFNHIVGGHFDIGGHLDAGTFTPTAGSTITLNGTEVQKIYGSSAINFQNLIVNNSTGIDVFTDVVVNDVLTLTAGTFDVGATTLTINGGLIKTSGFIEVNPLSSLTFGGTTGLALPGSLFLTSPSINNLTVNRAGGIITSSDFTISGILNLQSANPASGTIGSLDTGTHTITMGEDATTVGIGDVTGKVKRNTFLPNTEYTFGHQNSSVTFPDIGTLPTEIILKISIGVVPSWKTDALKRVYDISQIGGSGTRGVLKSHYLDSELNGLDENSLSFFSFVLPPTSTLIDRGLSELNITDNWITLSNTDFGNLPSSHGVIEHAFGVSNSNVITWDGSESIDWFDQYNWTPADAPSPTKHVVIPDASGTSRDPIITASSSSTILSLDVQPGGILTAGNSSVLTIVGNAGAWRNDGSFDASTGKVIFNYGTVSEIVTIAGSTDFYDIEIGPNTTFQPVPNNILRIAGVGTANGTSIVDFSSVNNTVEWNGTNQTIVNPNGIGGNTGYYNLILSGSGAKTLPTSTTVIKGNFSLSGSSSATATDSVNVYGNVIIGSGSTIATGAVGHLLQGNLENNGTIIPTAGGTISFEGTTAQTISGTSATTFDNLSIKNQSGVTQESDINVNNTLTLNDGFLSVGANALVLNGTISNPSGNIQLSSLSSLTIGGSAALTINNNLFNSNPVINNLTINRFGGVALGNESITVNGALTLTSGTLTIAANTLTLASASLSITSGDIDASNVAATMGFDNATAITLPASLFVSEINNLTITGAGGITASTNLTVDGVLSLQNANPSNTKGYLDMSTYTLNMGEASTTIGQGDVSGIIKRTTIIPDVVYSMGNQFTTISFPDFGTLPTQISLKVTMGTTPSWRPGAIKRVYDFIHTGGNGTHAVLKSFYLETELNSNDESDLVQFLHFGGATPFTIEYGRSVFDINNNWVAVSNVNIGVFASTFGAREIVLDESEITALTWVGATSTSWVTATNWTPQGAPSDKTVITIPDTGTTTFEPSIPEIATCKKIIIEAGGVLNSLNNGELTVTGSDGAWVNSGTFDPGTGTVIFNHGEETEVVTISGTNSFYNLTLDSKTWLQAAENSITNIAGQFSSDIITSIPDFGTNSNTVEYNGSKDQPVVSPGGSSAYHELILSGSGVKTLAPSSISVLGNLTINSNISATDNTMLLSGLIAQSVSGATAVEFNNLTIDNAEGVTLESTALTSISGTLLINTDKKLIVDPVAMLTVDGTFTNSAGNDGFVIESDASNTGSVITDEAVGATVERYMTGVTEWHLIGATVIDQDIWDLTVSAENGIASKDDGGTKYAITDYNEAANEWNEYTRIDPNSNFASASMGYSTLRASNGVVSFIGTLNSSTNLNIPISRSGFGWNPLGNPYPCALNATTTADVTNNFLLENYDQLDPEFAALYLWDSSDGSYKIINNSGGDLNQHYIQSGQGFFVRAKNGISTIDITTLMRSHNGVVPFKGSNDPWPTVKLRASGEDLSSITTISFNYEMTEGLDVTYDAGMFKSNPDFSLYSKLLKDSDADYSIQCLPDNKYDEFVIPIGIDVPAGTEIVFSAELINLPPDCVFHFEDKDAGVVTAFDSVQNSYKVTITEKTRGSGTFFLHTSSNTIDSVLEPKDDPFSVLINPQEGYLLINSSEDLPYQAYVYDVSGRLFISTDLVTNAEQRLNMPELRKGIYILQLINEKGVFGRKISWQ